MDLPFGFPCSGGESSSPVNSTNYILHVVLDS